MSIKYLALINTNGIGEVQKTKWEYVSWKYKLILRPLSDLTKEIKHSGKKFVPIVELLKLSSEGERWLKYHPEGKYSKIIHEEKGWYAKACFEFHSTIDISIHKGFLWNIPTWITNKLHEWHFDMENLIEKGLAIDINTLK